MANQGSAPIPFSASSMTCAFLELTASPCCSISLAWANSGMKSPSLSTGPFRVTSPFAAKGCAPTIADLVPELLACVRSSDRLPRSPDRECARSAQRRIRARDTGRARSLHARRSAPSSDCSLPESNQWSDGVAVRTDQDLIVVAHAPFATRQRPPRVAAQPGGEARRVPPATRARVARRLIDLIHASATTRPRPPRASSLRRRQRSRPWYSTMCVGS